MSISRYLAGDAAAHLLPERVRRFDGFIEQRGFWAVFYMRLTPGIPYNLVNYGAGLTQPQAERDGARHRSWVPRRARSPGWRSAETWTTSGRTEAKVAIGLLVSMAIFGAFLARRQLGSERSA